MTRRIHLFGASGSGTTTLGSALAVTMDVPLFDTDEYYWLPTEPPYQKARPPAERVRKLRDDMARNQAWISSGSLCGWGDSLVPLFDFAVYLTLPRELRMTRLKARELARYGKSALAPGGRMHQEHNDFLAWAWSYDEGGLDTRSKALHEAWANALPCPVLRLRSTSTVEVNVTAILNREQDDSHRLP